MTKETLEKAKAIQNQIDRIEEILRTIPEKKEVKALYMEIDKGFEFRSKSLPTGGPYSDTLRQITQEVGDIARMMMRGRLEAVRDQLADELSQL